MTIINTSPDRPIQLGYEGEDRVTVLRFRYSADEAQYVQFKDILYHDDWMLSVDDSVPYLLAQIVSINKDEYDELLEQLAIEDEIIVPNPEPEEEPSQEEESIPMDETNPKTIAQQLQEQINELSSQLALATRYAKL